MIRRPIAAARPDEVMLLALDEQDSPVVLESTAFHERQGRFSVLACRPIEVLTLNDETLATRGGERLGAGESIWPALEEAMAAVAPVGPLPPGPIPGWLGYVGYEAGRQIERLPGRAVRDTAAPDARLAFYDALLVYDALEEATFLVELEFDGAAPPGAGQAADALRTLAADAATRKADPRPVRAEASDARVAADGLAGVKANFEPDAYRRAVQRCIDYIAAGDIFQVNLSQRFEACNAPPPMEIYRVLRRRNPAWYAAYLRFESRGQTCAVLSCSPELFLQVRQGAVLTRPIKGTRGRSGDDGCDEQAARDLWNSPKDNAELAMIVDLLRNDLGRVCGYGSVVVDEARRLETHPTVLHLVASVRGVLRPGVGPAELLRATFPGGSITGAPKIRAMEIIDELEPCARGVYTGCVGLVGVDGRCDWNIAIRTLLWQDGRAWVQVGGGIVADSDPQAEYEETLHKARGMLEAVALAKQKTKS